LKLAFSLADFYAIINHGNPENTLHLYVKAIECIGDFGRYNQLHDAIGTGTKIYNRESRQCNSEFTSTSSPSIGLWASTI
jgi:hypothetical protein